MKNRDEITALVCRPHCRFYKPGEKEEMSCAGYVFLAEKIFKEFAIELSRKYENESPPDEFEHDSRIEAVICASCPFQKEDCDFMGEALMEDAVPCGGYVLLARLLAAGNREAEEWLELHE